MSEGIRLTVLGAGQSIGKSCFLLSVNGIHILLDCGCYVGKDTKKGLPGLHQTPKGCYCEGHNGSTNFALPYGSYWWIGVSH